MGFSEHSELCMNSYDMLIMIFPQTMAKTSKQNSIYSFPSKFFSYLKENISPFLRVFIQAIIVYMTLSLHQLPQSDPNFFIIILYLVVLRIYIHLTIKAPKQLLKSFISGFH